MIIQKNSVNSILLNHPKELYSRSINKKNILLTALTINILAIIIFSSTFLGYAFFFRLTAPLSQAIINIAIPGLCITLPIIHKFLKKCSENIRLCTRIMNKIKSINKTTDNQDFVIVKARFEVLEEKLNYYYEEIKQLEQLEKSLTQEKYKIFFLKHEIYSKKILKTKLALAQLFYAMKNPHDLRSINEIGKINYLTYDDLIDTYKENKDDYFIFYDSNRPNLTFTQIAEMSILNLSKKIF